MKVNAISCTMCGYIFDKKPVKCSNCKTIYCSSKCKKEDIVKGHKKVCVFTTVEHEEIAKKYMKDKIPVECDGKVEFLHLETHLQEILYPDGLSNTLDVIHLKDGSIEPIIDVKRASQLFGALYEVNKNEDHFKQIIKDKTKGYLQCVFRGFRDLAEVIHNNIYTRYEWVNEDEGDMGAMATMDRNGRQDGLLFGRLRIKDISGQYEYAVSTCIKLDLMFNDL